MYLHLHLMIHYKTIKCIKNLKNFKRLKNEKMNEKK